MHNSEPYRSSGFKHESQHNQADESQSELDIGPSQLFQSTTGNEAEPGWLGWVSKSLTGSPEEGGRDRLREVSYDTSLHPSSIRLSN